MLALYPKITPNTSLVFFHQTRVRSQLIYSLTLLGIFLALISLPFLYTTISIKSMGLIQSSAQKVDLLVPIGGRLLSVNLADNQQVTKGSTLLIIDGTMLKQQRVSLNSYVLQVEQQLRDAEKLINEISRTQKTRNPELKTSLYLTSWQHYIEQFQNATNARQQAERIYQRYRSLYHKNVVTRVEFELYRYNFEQALSEQQALSKKYVNQWQIEANQYYNELRDLQNQKTQLNEQVKQYYLKASLNGSIQGLTGLEEGSYVYANQKIGEISPDSTLLAYCYVKPSDVGLIRKGQSVRLQIDAFNYNQWGVLTGKIVDISDDVVIQNQSAYFKIKCRLDKNYLQLKNGYKGYLKKGMTFQASFTITKRSLYQLLYDKVDDWVNPN